MAPGAVQVEGLGGLEGLQQAPALALARLGAAWGQLEPPGELR